MKFKAWEDVDAPAGYTYGRFTDFARFEAAVRDRGAELRRVNGWRDAEEGVRWRGAVPVRGKTRGIDAKLTDLVAQELVEVGAVIGGMEVVYQAEFTELDETNCRVTINIELKPRTLAARLIVQSTKLARGRIKQRMEAQLARYGNEIEADYQRLLRENQGDADDA